MNALPKRARKPSWAALLRKAADNGGYFTLRDAIEAGSSSALLRHHLRVGRIERLRRGIYRLNDFPRAEQEELMVLLLWTESRGVFSHETALALHNLSDALPNRIHITVPLSWAARRLRVPKQAWLHFADIPKSGTTVVGMLPVTTAMRTIHDCEKDGVPADLIKQAKREALRRGLVRGGALAVRRQNRGGGRRYTRGGGR